MCFKTLQTRLPARVFRGCGYGAKMSEKFKKILRFCGSYNMKNVNLYFETLKSHENKNWNIRNNIDDVVFYDVFSRFN